ncbi:NmrA family NAD(P)-binding protein [Streptomyces sp. NPDC007157]|uniref:NmrA family NAD(P)-binding protein n=1 Tax=Streptomyces sp. NPDC007157 TaxID=3154681 RepID=UPI0033E025DB
MTIAVIGATGRVGSLVVEQLLNGREAVRVLVRDPDKAHRLFDPVGGDLDVRAVPLGDHGALSAALNGIRVGFIAMGSVGLEGNLQRLLLDAAARSNSLEQLVRLSVLNAGPSSLGLNQQGHWSIDFAAEALDLPYTTIRPSVFSASVLAGAAEIRSEHTWTGLADTGRVALSDHRDVAEVAVRILRDSTTWGTHYDLTGPRLVSWPDVTALLSAEMGETVEFRVVPDQTLVHRMIDAGIPPSKAELLITREWAILHGENERTTETIRKLLGRRPRTVETFLHDYIDNFR